MQYLEIILNLPVNQGFTYSYIPPENEKPELVPEIGKRAEIMFGNKKTQGFIIGIFDKIPENCPVGPDKIRPIKRIIDKEALFGKELIEMAQWISRYYLCTLGEAVFSMIPSGRRETSAGGFGFEEEVGEKKRNELSAEQAKAVDEILNTVVECPQSGCIETTAELYESLEDNPKPTLTARFLTDSPLYKISIRPSAYSITGVLYMSSYTVKFYLV